MNLLGKPRFYWVFWTLNLDFKTLKQLEKERLIRVLKKSGSRSYYLLATNFVDVYDQNVDHLPVKDVDYINRLSKTPSDDYKPQTPKIP